MWNYGKKSLGSKIFDVFNSIFLIFVAVVTIYPFLFALFASFSDPIRLMAHRGLLFAPLGFTLDGYKLVFRNSDILNGYQVTLFVVGVGTVVNLLMTILFGYVLSKRDAMLNGPLTVLVIFTMYFSGGLIPTFIVVNGLGLYDSLWALILPTAISTFNLIIMRTSILAVPAELEESARLDGANDIHVLYKIIIPMCVPTIAALGLFYAVGHWNNWASALIFIATPRKYPLQLVLRSILIQGQTGGMTAGTAYEASAAEAAIRLLKYSTVIVSIVPILMIYPFIQKYFTQGMMIGALKG